ncbi:MAG: histidine kinase [Ginsengibacter sp.]
MAFWVAFSLQTIVVATRMKGVADFFLYQSYEPALFFLCSVLPVCIFSVYISIYLLFPFLQKKRYAIFITGIAGLIIFNCISALFFYVIMRPYMCPDCNTVDLREEINIIGNNGINIASFMALVALGVKFTKHWYQQQIQNRILARQKINSELKLLKARIQPAFLFETLQALYYKIASDKNLAAEILLKFSELLSYMLYECNDEFVPIERELFVIHEFVELEKMMNETKVKLTDNITNEGSKKYIPSFILLSLIQNCVIAAHDNTHQELHHIHVKIHTENNILYCKIYIQPVDAGAARDKYMGIIDLFINRLETFYKSNYKLEISEVEEGKFIITMSLLLLDNFSSNKIEEISATGYADAHI